MDNPDVIFCVDRNARNGPDEPMIGQRLGPERIHLKQGNMGPSLRTGE